MKSSEEKPSIYWEAEIHHSGEPIKNSNTCICWGEHERGSHNFTNPADAERIVACVNAFQNIPEHALKIIVKEGLEALSRYEEYQYGAAPEWLLEAQEIHLGYRQT